jgi:hypothetical protein
MRILKKKKYTGDEKFSIYIAIEDQNQEKNKGKEIDGTIIISYIGLGTYIGAPVLGFKVQLFRQSFSSNTVIHGYNPIFMISSF